MAAYAALLSLTHIIDDLNHHPRPPISLPKKQVASLTAKLKFLQEFLESYNPHLSYSTEADPLEMRIADAAYAAEDAIESHIVDQITYVGKKISSNALYRTLKKAINDMASIEKKVMKIQRRKSTPPRSSSSSFSSSIAQKKRSMMVGADGALLEMKDKLTSHSCGLQIIPIVGMGGTVVRSEDIGVKFDHVGVLENVKKVLYETAILPLRRPELFSHRNILRFCTGILLFGPLGLEKPSWQTLLRQNQNQELIHQYYSCSLFIYGLFSRKKKKEKKKTRRVEERRHTFSKIEKKVSGITRMKYQMEFQL